MSFFRSTGLLQRTAKASLSTNTPIVRQGLLSNPALFHTSAARWALSADARKKIDAAVNAHDVVVFMKGTPELPMCGFSRATAQIIFDIYGVSKDKVK